MNNTGLVLAAFKRGWSRGVLALQLKPLLHERAGKAIGNFTHRLPAPQSDVARQPLKDQE